MFDQVEAHLAGPAHAAFHEPEVQGRVTVHETAEKNAACERVIGFGKVTDVIVCEVRDRGAIVPAAAPGVLGNRDAELDAALPYGFIIIRAVQRDRVDVPG